jgi:8-oxo-dGTP diphosphatase
MKLSVAAIAVCAGKLFIARRIPGGDMGGRWEFPGGKTEDSEEPKTALAREMAEEFGVPVTVGAKIASGSFTHNGQIRTLDGYLVHIADYHFALTEHTEWRWASIAEIETLQTAAEFTPSDYALLPQIKNFLSLSTAPDKR